MSIKLKAEKRGGEVMRSTAERRMAILEYMCERRHETLENLMLATGGGRFVPSPPFFSSVRRGKAA